MPVANCELHVHTPLTCATPHHQRSYLSCACKSLIGPISAGVMLAGPDISAALQTDCWFLTAALRWNSKVSRALWALCFIYLAAWAARWNTDNTTMPVALCWLMSTALFECVTHCQQLMCAYRSAHICKCVNWIYLVLIIQSDYMLRQMMLLPLKDMCIRLRLLLWRGDSQSILWTIVLLNLIFL